MKLKLLTLFPAVPVFLSLIGAVFGKISHGLKNLNDWNPKGNQNWMSNLLPPSSQYDRSDQEHRNIPKMLKLDEGGSVDRLSGIIQKKLLLTFQTERRRPRRSDDDTDLPEDLERLAKKHGEKLGRAVLNESKKQIGLGFKSVGSWIMG